MLVSVVSQDSQIPAHLTRTSISAICTGQDWTNSTVKGKVIHKGPLVSLEDDDFILKAVIQDVESSPNTASQERSINIVLMGAVAKDFSRTVSQGDVVVTSGFTVSKSPTFHKDKLHPCNLLLTGDDASIYVCRPQPDVNSSAVNRKRAPQTAEASRDPKASKYTYSRLDELKVGTTVNVYGVVIFFKQPYKSHGTDYCSTIKIIDQSNQKICCSIFRDKLEDHPTIFQIGDIIRMHRVKVKRFNDSLSLINTFGFSVVTFSGTVGEPIEPRTSSRTFAFDQGDQLKVEELRSWAAIQDIFPRPPSMTLSTVKPSAYFDLTCQLLTKAPIDATCTLLRVWDGTRCPHTLLKVLVESDATEGLSCFSQQRESLIANVLIYDNHVEVARELKPGDFLRIFNLRAIHGSGKVPGLTSSQSEELDHLAFHLHGGTAYGRGIRVLPQNSPDVQELKRVLAAFEEKEENVSDVEMAEVWCTPPESLSTDPEPVPSDFSTERSCRHDADTVTLSEVKGSDPGQVHHVRVQLRSYEPQKLYQALKLHCNKCLTMQDIPDEEHVAAVFSEASRDTRPCSAPVWALSGQVDLPANAAGPSNRALSLYLSSQLTSEGKNKQLIFLKGASLDEVKQLSASYLNIVPVQSSGGQLTLMDLTSPVLFRGRRRYYGCKRCSNAAVREPNVEGVEVVSEKLIAEALGVELMRYVLLLKLQLQDASDSLDVLLWRDAELFFNVSAEDVAVNQDSQNHICQTLDSLCPPEGSTAQRPWLDMCLTSYEAKGACKTIYQICNTTISKTTADPDPA